MPYPINESFTSGIPAGFFALLSNSGNNPSTNLNHNNALGCAVFDVPGGRHVLSVLAAGATSGFDFEADIEVASDYSGRKIHGLWFSTNQGGVSPLHGFGFFYDSSAAWIINGRDAAGFEQGSDVFGSPVVTIAGILTWKAEARSYVSSGGLYWSLKITVAGVVVFDRVGYLSKFGPFPFLMPGIYAISSKLNVHAIRAVSLPVQEAGSVRLPLSLASQALQPANTPFGGSKLALATSAKNIYQGGSGRVAGVVTIENVPGRRQVRLFNKKTALLVAEMWSSITGQYAFDGVDADQEYFVLAHDHLRVYNAVVQDMLAP